MKTQSVINIKKSKKEIEFEKKNAKEELVKKEKQWDNYFHSLWSKDNNMHPKTEREFFEKPLIYNTDGSRAKATLRENRTYKYYLPNNDLKKTIYTWAKLFFNKNDNKNNNSPINSFLSSKYNSPLKTFHNSKLFVNLKNKESAGITKQANGYVFEVSSVRINIIKCQT